jgi:HK97 gp10 family phage protein
VIDIKVKGLSELQKVLDTLPKKIERNILRGALNAGAKPLLNAAKQNCPTGEPSDYGKQQYKLYNGALRDSIRISGRFDARRGAVISRIVAGGKARKTGANVFYAHMIEFGTKPHSITKGGKGEKNHPGTSPKPFMRPALDSESFNSVIATGEYIKKRLLTKHGIDTSDINLGVDLE